MRDSQKVQGEVIGGEGGGEKQKVECTVSFSEL
jgi:hypothetical protein